MSWTKKNVHPGKIVATSQEVEVQVLEVDPIKRRISLGLKQTLANPWESFAEHYPVGSVVEGEVKNKTEFGLFIGLDGDVDGMVHLSDLDWNRPGEQAIEDFKKGDMVRAQVLDVDVEKERISLGIKQMAGDALLTKPSEDAAPGDGLRKGQVVTCEIIEVKDGGVEVKIAGSDMTTLRQARRTRPRPQRPASRPLCGRRKGRCPHHAARPQGTQDRRIGQGTGDGGRERSHRSVWLRRLGCLTRRHSWRGAQETARRSELRLNRPLRRPYKTLAARSLSARFSFAPETD